MNPGSLDTRATFRRRAILPGGKRGDFADFLTRWAGYKALGGSQLVEAGFAEDQVIGRLRLRDGPAAREITAADRVRFKGSEFAIDSVALPERRGGFIDIMVKRASAG